MRKNKRLAWLIIYMLGVLFATPFSYEKVHAETILETDVETASDGCIFLGVYGSYYSQAQDALDRINEIRKEACEAGNVPDPRNSSRMLTSSDYVPIKWSADLESVARIRAVEGGLAYSFLGSGHNRLNGKGWSTVTFNDMKTSSEVLAYSYSTSMVYGINMWYDEKSDWVNQVSGAMTGHYESMINPNYTYVGLGDFYTEASAYPNTLAGEFSATTKALSQTMQQAPTDVMQKIEVKKSYITGYVLEGADSIYTDKTTSLIVKAILTNGSKTNRLWVLDTLTYVSSDSAVASVSSAGVVTGLKNGTTTITAKSGNTVLASINVQVKCNHSKELVSETPATCTKTGVKIYSCETCGDAMEQEIAMKPHNYSYGDADADGYRTGTCVDCSNTIRIIPPTTMNLWWKSSTVENDYYYSAFPASNSIGTTIFCWIADVDGDSSYRDIVMHSTDQSVITVPENPVANSSRNQLNVVGAGITTITIYPRYNPDLKRSVIVRVGDTGSVDFSVADIALSQTSYDYTGVACTPSVVVSYHDTMLTDGKDYNVSYENNTEVGVASVVIKGCGIFSGTVRKTYNINHSEHTFGSWAITKEATCVQAGEKRRSCIHCNAYETETIAMLEHDLVVDAAVEATCKETGLTEGSHCRICNAVIAAQSVVAAKGHAYVDGQCTNCSDIIYANINGLTYTILETEDATLAVSVTAQEGVTLSGTVNIPSMVEIAGREYCVTTIGANAFAGREELLLVTVPSTVNTVDSLAFAQCSNLQSVKFYSKTAPAAAEDIFEGTSDVALIALEGATGYETLATNAGVTLTVEHIHNMTYYAATPAGCEHTGNVAYYACNSCHNLYSDAAGNMQLALGDTVLPAVGHTYVDGQCETCQDIIYANINGLTYTILESEGDTLCVRVKAQEGVSLSGMLNIPSTVELGGKTYAITCVEENAFVGQEDITSVTIPATVTNIEEGAFAGCSNLASLKFFGIIAPTVADDALDGVADVELVVSEDAIGYDTLAENIGATLEVTHVHDMNCHEAVEAGCETTGSIAYYVCDGCENVYADEFGNAQITLDDIVVPAKGHSWDSDYTIDVPATSATDGVKSIHCSNCSAKKDEQIIPATGSNENDNQDEEDKKDDEEHPNEEIPDESQQEIPGGVPEDVPGGMDDTESEDKDNADATDDANGQSVLPTGVLFKKNGAMYKVVESDAKSQTFSVSLVKVLSKKVKTFKVPSSVTYNGASYKVVTIGKKAFSGCKKLKKLTLGSNVKTISDRAFYSCSILKSITIPATVTKIGKEAFAKCKKLSMIKLRSNNLTASKIGKNAFKGIRSNATIKVPKKKMKAYKAMLRKKGVSKKAKFKKL